MWKMRLKSVFILSPYYVDMCWVGGKRFDGLCARSKYQDCHKARHKGLLAIRRGINVSAEEGVPVNRLDCMKKNRICLPVYVEYR